jgi:hypothetical protein
LLIIDALRYDVVANDDLLAKIAPNLAHFKAMGACRAIIANASNTQFVMPSVLTGTYPLDAGGTNWGCSDRKSTLAEVFKTAGYETRLLSTCVLYDRALDFDRGFDKPVVAVNRRRALMQDIEYGVQELARRCLKPDVGAAEKLDFIVHLERVLQKLIRIGSNADRIPSSMPRLARYGMAVSNGAKRELAMLIATPLKAAKRVVNIPEAYLYASLGREPGIELLLTRLINKIGRPLLNAITPTYFRAKLIDAYEPVVEELDTAVAALLSETKGPFFAMAHLMDAHSAWPLVDQLWRNPLQTIKRVRQAKRYMRDIPSVPDIQTGLYLAGINAVDSAFGRQRTALDDAIGSGNLVLLVTGDHGNTIEAWDNEKPRDLNRRFRTTDILTPMVLCGGSAKQMRQDGLFDSRDVAATLLDAVGLVGPADMQGRSAVSGAPRNAVISENAGRGFCDLARDDINFAITSAEFRLYITVKGQDLTLDGLYHLKDDPHEAENLLESDPNSEIAIKMLAIWRVERSVLIERRGIL